MAPDGHAFHVCTNSIRGQPDREIAVDDRANCLIFIDYEIMLTLRLALGVGINEKFVYLWRYSKQIAHIKTAEIIIKTECYEDNPVKHITEGVDR